MFVYLASPVPHEWAVQQSTDTGSVCVCVCVCHTAPAFNSSHVASCRDDRHPTTSDAIRPKALSTLLKCRHGGNAENFHSGWGNPQEIREKVVFETSLDG